MSAEISAPCKAALDKLAEVAIEARDAPSIPAARKALSGAYFALYDALAALDKAEAAARLDNWLTTKSGAAA